MEGDAAINVDKEIAEDAEIEASGFMRNTSVGPHVSESDTNGIPSSKSLSESGGALSHRRISFFPESSKETYSDSFSNTRISFDRMAEHRMRRTRLRRRFLGVRMP